MEPKFMWGVPLGYTEEEPVYDYDDKTRFDVALSANILKRLEPTGIDATLQERGSRYGSFIEQGRIEQNIKRAFADSDNWATLPDDSRSALEMIATKISRILKGDPEYADSWHDIIGYAKLVEDRINGD